MEYMQETMRTKVEGSYDVAVCGGGFGGIAAALAAARHGAKVVLFERQFMLGGLGTAGLITIYLPLCDGCGRQVSFGLAEELLRESIRDGAEDKYPDNWLDGDGPRTREDKRYQVRYNPQLFAIRAEQMLLEAGVNILYGTYAVGADVQEGKVRHLITENKSGRRAWQVKSVVDATGDADIALLAGVPTATFWARWTRAAGKRQERKKRENRCCWVWRGRNCPIIPTFPICVPTRIFSSGGRRTPPCSPSPWPPYPNCV